MSTLFAERARSSPAPSAVHSTGSVPRIALTRVPSLSELNVELAYRSLFDFFRLSWPVLEATQKLVLNWHLEAMCDHIQTALEDWIAARGAKERDEVFQQRIKNLVINVPPGSSKSRILSVCAPAWMWLRYPSWRVLCLSSNPRVAMRDAMLCRDLVESSWYQQHFIPFWALRNDQNAKSLYWTTEGGFRASFGWFAKITGDRADAIILDDPHDAEEVKSDKSRLAVLSRWDNAIVNRVNDATISVRIGVMQRLHQLDWSGHVLNKGGWAHLCIEQEYEPHRRKEVPNPARNEIPRETTLGWSDPRTRPGELLDPVRTPASVLEEEKAGGSFYYAGQHQQRPAPLEGGIWKRQWWGYWVPRDMILPPVRVQLADGNWHECAQKTLPVNFDFMLQSWDMAFGKSETSSMVVGQVWALRQKDRFLMDQVRRQMDFVETQNAFRVLSLTWPEVETKLVENKANGPAIISSLRDEFSGILAVDPEGDKTARAMAEQSTIESGHVWLPHPSLFHADVLQRLASSDPAVAGIIRRALQAADEARARAQAGRSVMVAANWVDDFVEEAASFPSGAFKDVVDTASQALMRLRKWLAAQEDDTQHSVSGQSMFGRTVKSGR